jgi:SWI/SNF-related matrix-associated actin-dependent regulator 1 of chromatin subfamily A
MSKVLYPFQELGAEWLADRDRALLADEMGLGKTVQAVVAAGEVMAEKVLVVCKAIGKDHWAREFAAHSRTWRPQVMGSQSHPLDSHNVHIVNYDVIHQPRMLKRLLMGHWDVLIADEMHMLKSVDSKRTQALLDPTRGIWTRAGAVWGLSGTPAPNHPGELWPWLRTLHPDRVKGLNYEGFLDKYLDWVDGTYGPFVRGIRNQSGWRALMDPIMLRRRRTEVLRDLPPLLIDQLLLSSQEALPTVLGDLEGHPEAGKVRQILSAMGPQADPQDLLLEASMDPAEIRRMYGLAKVPLIVRQVQDELDGGQDKVVIMGWHRDVLEQIVQGLKDYGPVLVYGGMTSTQMADAVDRFQNHPACRVFVGNILSAGTSITLTAANRLIFAEYSWVPGENQQALLRILRIGQDRPCRVSFASLAGSLDEVITYVFQRKAKVLEDAFTPHV